LVERLLPFREKLHKARVYVDRYGSARADSLPTILAKQVAFDIGIASAAHDPDITRTEALPKFRQNAQFVVAAVNAAVGREPMRLPFWTDEAARSGRGHLALAALIESAEQIDSLQQRLTVGRSFEVECLQQRRTVLPVLRVH